MCHYQKNIKCKIRYRLYAHFPNETVGRKLTLNIAEITNVLQTKNKNLQKYITELVGFTDFAGFISRFEMEFGASLEDLQKSVIVLLTNEGFSTEDVEEIFIQMLYIALPN